ncbi:MAG: tyrosine-type recombinase/integrase, partial [Candidatus Marinimicrobia bacterium]|nr:tyrosine-type recombinase/integrase [Candidatus Neomarinimicrobiota bacterium]
MGKLKPLHVQAVYAAMSERGLAARTIVQAHRMLRQALQHALKWQLVSRNVADSIQLPKPERYEPMMLEPDKLRDVLAAADETAYGMFVYLAAATGLRQSELCALSWADTDLERGSITVSRSLHWLPRQGFITRQPKTASSIRSLALSVDTVKRRREHRHDHPLPIVKINRLYTERPQTLEPDRHGRPQKQQFDKEDPRGLGKKHVGRHLERISEGAA